MIFHVAPHGDDRGSGSENDPWRTISRGGAALGPGVTVAVHAGTYHEQVTIERSGREGAPAILTAAETGEVIIEGEDVELCPAPSYELPKDRSSPEISPGSQWPGAPIAADERFAGLIQAVGVHDLEINGFVVRNAGQTEHHAGVFLRNSVRIGLRRLQTYNTRSSGIGVWRCRTVAIEKNEVILACNDGRQECITVAGTLDFRVTHNRVHQGGPGTYGGEGIDIKQGSMYGSVVANHVHDNQRLGIYVEAWDRETHDVRVEGNFVYRNNADGITLASEMGGLLHDVTVCNNVIYENTRCGIVVGWYGDVPRQPIENIRFLHNTIVRNGRSGAGRFGDGGGLWFENKDASDITVRNNLFVENGRFQIGVEEGIPIDSRSIEYNWFSPLDDPESDFSAKQLHGDPQLTDIEAGDFRPIRFSAVGARCPRVDGVSIDIDGQLRGSEMCTIGAYENSWSEATAESLPE